LNRTKTSVKNENIGNQDFLLLINLIRDLHSQLETLFIHTHTHTHAGKLNENRY
jgi:hypothetical protein